MLDINDIRENSEKYRKNQAKAGKPISDIDEVLKIDKEWRKSKQELDELRAKRNKVSEDINKAKKEKDNKLSEQLIKEAKEIPEQVRMLEEKEQDLKDKMNKMLSSMPNIISDKTPIGKDSSENKEIKKGGKIQKFTFTPKTHVELAENLGLTNFDASAKTSGNGFYYLKNELALLNQALIRFAIDFMIKKGYEYIETPLMIRKELIAASGDTTSFANSIYEVKDTDLAMIGTAEHSLLAIHTDQTLTENELPKKYFSYSMCFRKEIGAHGINEKGLWRTHQFNKVEQFIFCRPEDSEKLYEELMKNSEEILKQLELPYRIIEICTGDLAVWKFRSADLEVWRPTTKEYGEVMSLSNCTDYQARKLNIKVLRKDGKKQVLHTLNDTALATSRILVAILENNQQKDGSILVPKVLQKYTGFKKIELKQKPKKIEKKKPEKKTKPKTKKSKKK